MKKIIVFTIILFSTLFNIYGNNDSNLSQSFLLINQSNFSKEVIFDINPYKDISSKKIKINSKIITFDKYIEDDFKKKLDSNKNFNQYAILQFNINPTKNDLNKLHKEGIKILDHIGTNTYNVKFTEKFSNLFEENLEMGLKLKSNKINNKYLIKNILSIKPEYKLNTYSKIKDNSVYLLSFYDDVNLNSAEKFLDYKGIEIIQKIDLLKILVVKISKNELEEIMLIPEIKKISQNYPKPENQLENSLNLVDLYYVKNQSYYNLTGININILQFEKGVPEDHLDFYTRVTKESGSDIDSHATFVAGILIGNGTVNLSYQGVATKSNIYSYQIDDPLFGTVLEDLTDNFIDAINNDGVELGSNSWGTIISGNCSLGGDYSEFSETIDKFITGNFTNSKISQVFSTGNYRDNCGYSYNTIVPEASSKNIISVGGVEDDFSFYYESGVGPTDDGKLKPEIMAPACINSTNSMNTYRSACGTSMAAPHVSGTIALMLEQWNKQYTNDPLPSTIKALLLDSSTDLHRSGNGSEVIDGPDYVNGFGLLNAKGAVDRIINETFIESNISDVNDVDIYSINITNQSEIKVTLAWDDPAGPILYNDLDLKLVSPTGNEFYPWVLDPNNPQNAATRNNQSKLKDNLNNVEQVYVNTSEIEEGEWLIVIDATQCTTDCPQKYSIVSENKLFVKNFSRYNESFDNLLNSKWYKTGGIVDSGYLKLTDNNLYLYFNETLGAGEYAKVCWRYANMATGSANKDLTYRTPFVLLSEPAVNLYSSPFSSSDSEVFTFSVDASSGGEEFRKFLSVGYQHITPTYVDGWNIDCIEWIPYSDKINWYLNGELKSSESISNLKGAYYSGGWHYGGTSANKDNGFKFGIKLNSVSQNPTWFDWISFDTIDSINSTTHVDTVVENESFSSNLNNSWYFSSNNYNIDNGYLKLTDDNLYLYYNETLGAGEYAKVCWRYANMAGGTANKDLTYRTSNVVFVEPNVNLYNSPISSSGTEVFTFSVDASSGGEEFRKLVSSGYYHIAPTYVDGWNIDCIEWDYYGNSINWYLNGELKSSESISNLKGAYYSGGWHYGGTSANKDSGFKFGIKLNSASQNPTWFDWISFEKET